MVRECVPLRAASRFCLTSSRYLGVSGSRGRMSSDTRAGPTSTRIRNGQSSCVPIHTHTHAHCKLRLSPSLRQGSSNVRTTDTETYLSPESYKCFQHVSAAWNILPSWYSRRRGNDNNSRDPFRLVVIRFVRSVSILEIINRMLKTDGYARIV